MALNCCGSGQVKVHVQHVPEAAKPRKVGDEVYVLSFNAFCRPPGIKNKANDWKSERLDCIADQQMAKFDVAGFQELFGSFSFRRSSFLKKCAKSGHGYYVTSPSPSWKFLIDGGLAIVSKLPIVEAQWSPFEPGMYSDRCAEKGVLYAKIAVNARAGLFIHVFNAHTQSSYADPPGTKAWKIRERQTRQMLDFVQTVTANDAYPTIIMGDLNINANKEMPTTISSKEYTAFFQLLQGMKSKRGAHDASPQGYHVSDLLFDFNNKTHPITFGEAKTGPNGEMIPLETVFTQAHDYGTAQSLDYIFWLIRPDAHSTTKLLSSDKKAASAVSTQDVTTDGKTQRRRTTTDATSSNSPSGTELDAHEFLELNPARAVVEKMFVQQQVFTQLSDHYGASATFVVAEQ